MYEGSKRGVAYHYNVAPSTLVDVLKNPKKYKTERKRVGDDEDNIEMVPFDDSNDESNENDRVPIGEKDFRDTILQDYDYDGGKTRRRRRQSLKRKYKKTKKTKSKRKRNSTKKRKTK